MREADLYRLLGSELSRLSEACVSAESRLMGAAPALRLELMEVDGLMLRVERLLKRVREVEPGLIP